MPQTHSRGGNHHAVRPRNASSRSERNEIPRPENSAGAIEAIGAEIGELSAEDIKAGLRMQAEMFEALHSIGRDWMARATSQAELAFNLPNRLTTARSVPDAISAYQEWFTEWLARCGEDSRRLISDGKKIANAARVPPK
jgi:hypothetical protein